MTKPKTISGFYDRILFKSTFNPRNVKKILRFPVINEGSLFA